MENEENYDVQTRKNGFLDFLSKIWSAKISFAIATCVAAIVIGLGMGVVMNNARAKYETEVLYKFPGASSGRYADGTVYNYMNNVSYANLLAAKESDQSFASIDIDTMSSKSDITVTLVSETASDGTETKTPAHLLYSVSAKYFASYGQARNYLDALAEIPTEKAATIAANETYDYSLLASKSALSYDSQIDYLSAQYNLLNNGYQALLSSYGSSVTYTDKSGTTALVRKTYLEFQNYFATHSISTIQEVLRNSGFVKSTDTSARVEAEARIVEIDRAIEQNTIEIDALTEKYKEIYKGEGTTGASPFAGRIQELITQNTALAKEKEYLERKLTHINTAPTEEEKKQQEAFENLLKSITAYLGNFVDEYTVVQHDVQSRNIVTTYAQSSHTISTGAFAWYVSATVAVLGGLVIGLFVAYFKGLHNSEKSFGDSK